MCMVVYWSTVQQQIFLMSCRYELGLVLWGFMWYEILECLRHWFGMHKPLGRNGQTHANNFIVWLNSTCETYHSASIFPFFPSTIVLNQNQISVSYWGPFLLNKITLEIESHHAVDIKCDQNFKIMIINLYWHLKTEYLGVWCSFSDKNVGEPVECCF